jgi:hypothetical protein
MPTRIVDDRDTALQIGYKATNWQYPISYEQHVDIAEDWDVKLIERDGQPIGAMFEKDGEVHCSILPEWRRKWLTKGLLKQIIERPNFHTQVDDGHDYMYGILERLGMARRPDGTFGRI